MPKKDGWETYHQDKLVFRCRNKLTKENHFQGKRLPNNFNLMTKEEVRLYVKQGTVKAVCAIKRRLLCGLADALVVLNKARY